LLASKAASEPCSGVFLSATPSSSSHIAVFIGLALLWRLRLRSSEFGEEAEVAEAGTSEWLACTGSWMLDGATLSLITGLSKAIANFPDAGTKTITNITWSADVLLLSTDELIPFCYQLSAPPASCLLMCSPCLLLEFFCLITAPHPPYPSKLIPPPPPVPFLLPFPPHF
jgi:hypothetical protein